MVIGKYQTARRRFWAGFIDGLVFSPLAFVDSWVLAESRPGWLIITWMLFVYPVNWLYGVLMHGFFGQTLGKMALGVKVLDVSESPMSMRQAFLRDSFYIAINTLLLAYSIYLVLIGVRIDPESFGTPDVVLGIAALLWFVGEIVSCLLNKKRRALHDFIAGTVVVNVEHIPLEMPYLQKAE